MNKKYFIDTRYAYNEFGANEHYIVELFKLSKKGNLKRIGYWSYSTFPPMGTINRKRSERRIRELRQTYDASFL